jgi:hypothetical protein
MVLAHPVFNREVESTMAKTKLTKSSPAKARVLGRAAKPQKPMAPSAELALGQALKKHPRRKLLVKAGALKDQLLRALVPLYLTKGQELEVSSGTISRFWESHGVRFAPPNAAKAFRQHEGYAKRTKNGRQITASGVKYVEAQVKTLG